MERITPDQVERALREEERKIAQARANQVQLLRVADAMQLPTADGCKSMPEWLAGRLDVSSETARALTATAKRLEDNHSLSRRLASGEITYDRAQASSRIPSEAHDATLDHLDIQGLRRFAARYRRMERVDEEEAHRSQHLTMQPNLDESQWALWGSLDGYTGAVVSKVLVEEADRLPDLPDGERPGLGYRQAVALLRICEDRHRGASSGPVITVFLDEKGAETQNGTAVGLSVVDKIACAGSLEAIRTVDGEPLASGRLTRVISKKMKRFILHRDGGCAADGCTSRYRLEPHHIVPWSEGGPTDPDNLVALCWFHHHVVIHGWGYRMDTLLGRGRVRFIRPPDRGPPTR